MSVTNEPTPNVHLQLLQANERTVLAWIRTGLAIMAFGFVVARIGLWLHMLNPGHVVSSWSGAIGIAFMLLGMATQLIAAQRYAKTRRAILSGETVLAGPTTILFMAVALTALGALLIAAITTSHL